MMLVIKRAAAYLVLAAFLCGSYGCQSIAKKFVRKPKAEEQNKEEVVFAPQEYPQAAMSNQELYQQYYLYWNTWQDELIDSLVEKANRKGQLQCLDQALVSLRNIRLLINEKSQKELDGYLSRLEDLRRAIVEDRYGDAVNAHRKTAALLKRDIAGAFSFKKMKENIQ